MAEDPSQSDPLFVTARLRCRRWTSDDAEAIYAIYADEEAARYVDDGQPITWEDTERWIDITLANYERRGYGMFALDALATGAMIGCCGLVHPDGQVLPEIKYAFRRECWGQGLASEAVPALLDFGGQRLEMPVIIATVAEPNLASRRVLESAGAAWVRNDPEDDGSVTCLYHWNRPS